MEQSTCALWGVETDCSEVSALKLPPKYALYEKVNARVMELHGTFYPYTFLETSLIPLSKIVCSH